MGGVRMRRELAFGWRDRILVVGTGPAGLAAADELRRLGFMGDLVVLGDEAPYDRPACSKGLLTGHQTPRDVMLPLPEAPMDLKLGRRAVSLDAVRRLVATDTGEIFEYDGLVIASGGYAALPTDWPVDEPNLYLLHSVTDAWAVRQALRDARRVAIVGGGLTGCEAASAVRGLAREAIVIDSRPCLMYRALGEPVGSLVTQAHWDEGVETRLNRRVSFVERRRNRWRLTLDDGEYVQADVVLVTVGERADTRWLAGSGLDVRDGVRCDQNLRVLGADAVVAAGVVARWPNLRFGTEPGRVGQWIAAIEQGRAAAQTLLAGDRPVPPVTLLPRFWSMQGDLRIQACGRVDYRSEVSITQMRPGRRDTARSGLLASFHRDGRVVGLVAVNAPQAFTASTRAMLEEVPPDVISTGRTEFADVLI
jgi:NADPH-dependent 2,4-dienoyl-CoA reductase/sulfur reductase-like enzyme